MTLNGDGQAAKHTYTHEMPLREIMAEARLGKGARVHYKASLEDGMLLDSSWGGNPLEFTFGRYEVFSLFEEVVGQMTPGETRQIRISAEQWLNSVLESMAALNGEIVMGEEGEVDGSLLCGSGGLPMNILDTADIADGMKGFLVDHPLAGKDILFEIHLLAILSPE